MIFLKRFSNLKNSSVIVYVRYLLTFAGGVRIFPTIESMHLLMIPRFSDHSVSLTVVCNVIMESFQPTRMQELKKASSLRTKFPFSTASVIRRNFAAQNADTKL